MKNHRDIPSLQQTSFRLRQRILAICVKAGTGHLTSSFSCVEILTALFYGGILHHDPLRPDWPERDRFILSKGQASPAIYAVLADRGYFPDSWLDYFAQVGGKMGVHLQQSVPGAEITCGSLGQGFGLAVGMSLAAKMDGKSHRVYCLLGDGECWEGSVWEAAMFASHHGLENLVAIIDRNQMSVMGRTEDIMGLDPLEGKWRSLGWNSAYVNGHSYDSLLRPLLGIYNSPMEKKKPLVIIAETIKGYPIKEIEGQALWHGVAPDRELAARWVEQMERSGRGDDLTT